MKRGQLHIYNMQGLVQGQTVQAQVSRDSDGILVRFFRQDTPGSVAQFVIPESTLDETAFPSTPAEGGSEGGSDAVEAAHAVNAFFKALIPMPHDVTVAAVREFTRSVVARGDVR
jgi:hypothetical protein